LWITIFLIVNKLLRLYTAEEYDKDSSVINQSEPIISKNDLVTDVRPQDTNHSRNDASGEEETELVSGV